MSIYDVDLVEPERRPMLAALESKEPASGKAAGDLTVPELRWLAEHGKALPDENRGGSFPIRNTSDLASAKSALGRAGAKGTAGYERAHRWINKRAKELGAPLLGET